VASFVPGQTGSGGGQFSKNFDGMNQNTHTQQQGHGGHGGHGMQQGWSNQSWHGANQSWHGGQAYGQQGYSAQ
jgi:hypothetical protein